MEAVLDGFVFELNPAGNALTSLHLLRAVPAMTLPMGSQWTVPGTSTS